MERDRANLFVLEGVIIALLLLGAAYTVRSLQELPDPAGRPRTELDRLSHDALVVLDGIEVNGSSLLDLYVVEAWHCAKDATPSVTDCDGRRARNLSVKLDNYLPLGAGYAVFVGNGVGARQLYRSPLPAGESVAAAYDYQPEWNLTFLFSEFSCYEAGTDVNLTLVPIDRGATRWTRWGNATYGSTEVAGVRAFTPGWWNVTLPAATRPASATIHANVTGNHTSLEGSTAYGSCGLGGLTSTLRTALRDSTFSASAASVPLGGTVVFTADLTPLAGVPGVSITAAEVLIVEPVSIRPGTPDAWIEATRTPLSTGTPRVGSWTVPEETLYGRHPALLRVSATVGSTAVEFRRATVVDVALPDGQVPFTPPYRLALQSWLADWG